MAESQNTTPAALTNSLNAKLAERSVHNTAQSSEPEPAPVAPLESAKAKPGRKPSAPAAKEETKREEAAITAEDIDAKIAELERQKAALSPLVRVKEKTIKEIFSKCVNCGSDLNEDRICDNCGYDLSIVNNVQLDNERIKEILA